MALIFYIAGIALFVLGAFGHIALGHSKVDLGNGMKFTVPAWLGGTALFLVLGYILP